MLLYPEFEAIQERSKESGSVNAEDARKLFDEIERLWKRQFKLLDELDAPQEDRGDPRPPVRP